jgi:dTDP-4-dehydrorhamnose 3,5-epimerase-like enzyme
MPWDIFVKNQCGNFKHWREITISYQNPQMFTLLNEYSHGLMQQDYYYLGDNNYLFRLEFHNQGNVIVRNYRCKKIQ